MGTMQNRNSEEANQGFTENSSEISYDQRGGLSFANLSFCHFFYQARISPNLMYVYTLW